MMRSLSSGVAGLRTHQTKMDVIGNNIANVNTYGFKSSRTTFADVYYQNIAGASAGTTGVQGGRNATQIGYGSSVATIDVMNSVSGAATTDFAMDVYIQGDGFLVCKDTAGRTSYTRLGKLDFDSAGNLVDGNGNMIQGFPMNEDGTPRINPDGTIEASDLRAIVGDPEILQKLTGISISPTGLIVGTLEGDKTIKVATSLPSFIDKDSITINKDSNFVGDVKLAVGAMPEMTDLQKWLTTTVAPAYDPGAVTNVNFGDVGLPAATAGPPPVTYAFEVDGKNLKLTLTDGTNNKNDDVFVGTVQEDGSVVLKSKNSGNIAMSFKVENIPASDVKFTAAAADVEAGMKDLKYQVTTRDKGENIVKLPESTNGTFTIFDPAAPKFENLGGINIEVDPAKMTEFKPTVVSVGTATPGNDVLYTIGNLALAKFPNPNGMSESGNSYFAETANSGEPVFVKPGVDGTGAMKAGYLEMSNVDVSKEFTDMITTQRGFQANSRIITVSDTMLEELVNLKR